MEVEGDLVATLTALLRSNLARKGPGLLSRLRRLFAPNSVRRARRNAAAHYDLGNEFYELWLDETMTYSGAVFPNERATLYQAQRNKCDLICRKLDLQSGECFLDIGCGWGYLVQYAVEKYGAEGVGVTPSPDQQRYGSEWIARRGLSDRARVEQLDYRRIGGVFDKIASVGMLEHVGRAHLGAFFRAVAKALRLGGRCVIQVIVQRWPEPVTDFTAEVFPGGYFPTGAEILRHAAAAGLDWRHADRFTEHYALTVRRWRENSSALAPESR